jgi:PHD/YefM family antitoxin component YafN of YafNO toxin-antitoxin module
MKNLTKEIDYLSLKNNFDDVCNEVNGKNEAMTLTLKSGRKVYLMPEENYDSISHFVVFNTSSSALTS